MTTKLTLTIEESVIKKAKRYARQTGRSLSELVEAHLQQITGQYKPDTPISPELRKIVGIVQLPEDFNEENELQTYYENKHL